LRLEFDPHDHANSNVGVGPSQTAPTPTLRLVVVLAHEQTQARQQIRHADATESSRAALSISRCSALQEQCSPRAASSKSSALQRAVLSHLLPCRQAVRSLSSPRLQEAALLLQAQRAASGSATVGTSGLTVTRHTTAMYLRERCSPKSSALPRAALSQERCSPKSGALPERCSPKSSAPKTQRAALQRAVLSTYESSALQLPQFRQVMRSRWPPSNPRTAVQAGSTCSEPRRDSARPASGQPPPCSRDLPIESSALSKEQRSLHLRAPLSTFESSTLHLPLFRRT
jgi:hypothetical protein